MSDASVICMHCRGRNSATAFCGSCQNSGVGPVPVLRLVVDNTEYGQGSDHARPGRTQHGGSATVLMRSLS
jgi:hypothetical protein